MRHCEPEAWMAFTFGAAKGPVFTRWTMEIKGLEGQRSQSTLSHKHSQCLGECTENVYWHQKTCSLVEIPGLVMSTMLWAASSAASFDNGKKTRRKDSLTQTGPLSVWTNRRKTTACQDCYNRRKDVLCYRVVSGLFFSTSGRCSVSEPQLYAQALGVARDHTGRVAFIIWDPTDTGPKSAPV